MAIPPVLPGDFPLRSTPPLPCLRAVSKGQKAASANVGGGPFDWRGQTAYAFLSYLRRQFLQVMVTLPVPLGTQAMRPH